MTGVVDGQALALAAALIAVLVLVRVLMFVISQSFDTHFNLNSLPAYVRNNIVTLTEAILTAEVLNHPPRCWWIFGRVVRPVHAPILEELAK